MRAAKGGSRVRGFEDLTAFSSSFDDRRSDGFSKRHGWMVGKATQRECRTG